MCGQSGSATHLAQQLRHDLNLLAAGEQVPKGYARDTRHLHIVHQHHQALEKSKRQKGILQAVHGQAAARLLIPILGKGTWGQSGAQPGVRRGGARRGGARRGGGGTCRSVMMLC